MRPRRRLLSKGSGGSIIANKCENSMFASLRPNLRSGGGGLGLFLNLGMQHFLNFLPDPQGQGALRFVFIV